MAKDYQIKWKQSDYLTLGRAISNFNKKKNELERLEKYENVILPYTLNYQEVKENIKTRKELNRMLSSLREFGKGNSLEIYKTEAGDNILNWEHKELEKEKRRIIKRLTTKLENYEKPNAQGFTKAQMGNSQARAIMANIERFKEYEMQRGYDFKIIKNLMHSIGDNDYEFRKAIVYQENFMKELENLMKNSNEFKKVYDYFKKIKNPIEFFKTTQKSEVLQDFFLWYQQPENYASFSQDDLAEYILSQYE